MKYLIIMMAFWLTNCGAENINVGDDTVDKVVKEKEPEDKSSSPGESTSNDDIVDETNVDVDVEVTVNVNTKTTEDDLLYLSMGMSADDAWEVMQDGNVSVDGEHETWTYNYQHPACKSYCELKFFNDKLIEIYGISGDWIARD